MARIMIENKAYYFLAEEAYERNLFGKLVCMDNPSITIDKVICSNFGNTILVPDANGEIDLKFENKFPSAIKLETYNYPLIKFFKNREEIQYGRKKYTGRYIEYTPKESFKSIDFVFETLRFKEVSKLWQIQNDPYYVGSKEAEAKKREPKLFSFNSVDELEEFDIIHAVDVNGDSYVDLDSIERILKYDLGEMATPLKIFTYSCKRKYTFGITNYGGVFRLVRLKDIDFLFSDKGNSYYQRETQYQNRRRHHAGRYIYNFIKLMKNRRMCINREDSTPRTNFPGYKKGDFKLFFKSMDTSDFAIVYYSEINTDIEGSEILEKIDAIPQYKFDGYIDPETKELLFFNYTQKEIEDLIEKNIGLKEKINFRQLVSTWLKSDSVNITLSTKKANGYNVIERDIKIINHFYDSEEEQYKYSEAYINLADFIVNFCQDKKMSYFMDCYSKEIVPDLRDLTGTKLITYKKVDTYKLEENSDTFFSLKYIHIEHAAEICRILSTKLKKNSHWYRNVNKVFSPFTASIKSMARLNKLDFTNE